MTIGNLILVNFCHMNVLCIMQIATYNLNGIRSALNKGWMNWMQETSFDVVCIQELKAQNEQIDLEAFAQAGYHVYTETAEKKGYSGVAIFSKQKPDHVEYGCGNQEFDKEGRVIRADYGDLSVFSIYFPSGTTGDVRQSVKYVFLDYIYEYLMTLQKTRKKLVVCGDYNIAHREIDIHDPRETKTPVGFCPKKEPGWISGSVRAIQIRCGYFLMPRINIPGGASGQMPGRTTKDGALITSR